MKNLVIKTVFITLASLFGLLLLVFGALALFSPVTLAEVFDVTGSYSGSILFYEKQYDKTGDIEDLAVLSIKINQEVDAELAEKYLEKLVNHENFEQFCASEDGGVLSNKQFYVGKYALALVKNGKLDKALTVAEDFVNQNGYTGFNPYSVILVEKGKGLTAQQLNAIKAKIQSYSGADKENATADIEYIDNLISQK